MANSAQPCAQTSSPPVPLRIDGLPRPLQMHVHGEHDRHISRRIREQGIWEPYETSLLLSLLRPGDVFVDVGANIGYFSLVAATVVGSGGAVFAFEPDPANYSLLRDNARLNDCDELVSAVQAGLAAEAGEGRLYLSEDNLGDHQIFAADGGRSSLAVNLLNGSQYLGARLPGGRTPRLDVLKVDVQGAEYAVMQGLMPLLRSLQQLPRIILELTPLSLRQAGASGRLLIELLASLGQPLWIIDHIEHRLAASSAAELALWCDHVDAVTGDEGFMNILVGAMDE